MQLVKSSILLDNGQTVEALLSPVIVSASRCTDIPAFYSDWFLVKKSKGQRAFCGYIASKEMALANYLRIKATDQLFDNIIGK
jgi:hypothetical protein